MIRAFVADDHHLVRQGILALLERQSDVEIVGEAADGRDAVAQIKQLKPHIVLMDISMPQMDGIQVLQQLASEKLDTKVIVLSMHSKPQIILQALREGAQGYLLKKSMSEELGFAIRAAMHGHIYLSPEITTLMLQNNWNPQESTDDTLLSPRKREVLQLVAEGKTNAEVAELLSISPRTVEKHRRNVMNKLSVSDLPSLIREALKRNLIFLD